MAYGSHGPNWTMSVSDNGIGMAAASENAKPGLGTNIVESLAKRLGAKVQVAGANPGTAVSIVHEQIAAVHVVRNV